MKPLAFRQVSLTHFKNYAEAQFSFGDRFNLISGLNGIGKTNLLDSIYYLSMGKSYFTPYDQRVVRQGESFFRLEAHLRKGEQFHKLLIKARPGATKELLVDGVAVERISHHLGFVPVVFSAPRDIELVTGTGQSRRRYIDHLLCQIDAQYLKALVDYNYLLALRNATLKNGIDDLRRVIETYDDQMAPLATLIFEKRKWLTAQFLPRMIENYSILSEQRETIGFEYESTLEAYPYAVAADRNWEADKNTLRTNAGVHKDDFHLTVKDMPAKEFGSQGQIKSLIFSMHLTKYALLRDQTGYNPILILDDVFDKLDGRRLARLLEILSSNEFGQIFISDTSSERMSEGLKGGEIAEIKLM